MATVSNSRDDRLGSHSWLPKANSMNGALSIMAPRAAVERPPCSLNGADWGTSDAKQLTAQDMLDEIVPHKEKIKDPQALFNQLCAHQPKFANFPWDLERHKSRFSRIQTVVRRMKWASDTDKKPLAEARAMCGTPTHYPNGKPVWRGLEAANQLDQDLVNGLVESNMLPSDVFDMHDCHKEFGVKRLGQRLDQLREKAKPHGENPMQAASKRAKKELKEKRKVKDCPQLSRRGSVKACSNEQLTHQSKICDVNPARPCCTAATGLLTSIVCNVNDN